MEASKYGVSHSDELWFLWNTYFGKHWINRPEDQVNISNNMLDMWVNFARDGDPTPPDWPVTWLPVAPGPVQVHGYLILGQANRFYLHKLATVFLVANSNSSF